MTASVSGSAEDAFGFSGNTGMIITTTTTTTITSHNGLGGAKYRSWSIMGDTQDTRDNTIEVTYSTKHD